MLNYYESFFPHNVQNNDNDRRKEKTDMNNHNDKRTSTAQGHTINNTPNNCKHTRIIEKTSTNGHIDKTNENINTQDTLWQNK